MADKNKWADEVAQELVDEVRETGRDGLTKLSWQEAVALVAGALLRAAKYPNG